MTKQTLTQAELNAMVASMDEADFGPEIDIEVVDEDAYDDGQPSEYDEWQDYMGGDDWDQGQYETEDYFDGGVDF